MCEKNYPWLICIYKGENRIAIIPIIEHIYGYSIQADYCVIIKDEKDIIGIGQGILDSVNYIRETPVSNATPKERKEFASAKASKYKSWSAFTKHNELVDVSYGQDGSYCISGSYKNVIDNKLFYNGTVNNIEFSPSATPEELGQAVVDSFKAIEEFNAKRES